MKELILTNRQTQLTQFMPLVSFCTPGNIGKAFFRGYRERPAAWNGFIKHNIIMHICINFTDYRFTVLIIPVG